MKFPIIKLSIWTLMVLTICAQSCTAQSFTIEKGSHNPKPNPINYHSSVTEMAREVTFDSSCVYRLFTPDDSDINKLFGWGVGLFGSKHSIRIGWNCKNNTGIDLYAYIHFNGKRWLIPKDSLIAGKGQLIGSGFQPTIPVECYVAISDTSVIFECSQGLRVAKYQFRFANFPRGAGWCQYPYFGGTSVAPHRMKILIK